MYLDVFLECILQTTCVAAQEISEDIWKLLLMPALESWKNFCMLDNFVIFDDVYIMQQSQCIFDFPTFEYHAIMMRQTT